MWLQVRFGSRKCPGWAQIYWKIVPSTWTWPATATRSPKVERCVPRHQNYAEHSQRRAWVSSPTAAGSTRTDTVVLLCLDNGALMLFRHFYPSNTSTKRGAFMGITFCHVPIYHKPLCHHTSSLSSAYSSQIILAFYTLLVFSWWIKNL